MRVAPLVERLVGIAHGLWPRASQHHLEIHRLEAVVLVAVDDARRARDDFPRPECLAQSPTGFILDEYGEMTTKHEEHFFHFVRVRGIALPRLDIHDAERKSSRRDHARIAVFARAACADEAMLRALVAFDLRVLERRPIRFLLGKAADITLHDLFERETFDLGIALVASNAHVISPRYPPHRRKRSRCSRFLGLSRKGRGESTFISHHESDARAAMATAAVRAD